MSEKNEIKSGEQEREQAYLESRRDAVEAIRSSSDDFDRNILQLSVAFLGVSLSFMKDVVPITSATHLPCLYSSWWCFASATALVLISFWISGKAHFCYLRQLDDAYVRNREMYAWANSWDRHLKWLNPTSGSLFLAGVFLSVVFVLVNVKERSEMKHKDEGSRTVTHDGRVVIPPVQPKPNPPQSEERGHHVIPARPLPPSSEPQTDKK